MGVVKRFQCKACGKRSNFKPEFRSRLVRGRRVDEIFFRCPKCFCEGWFRFFRNKGRGF